ncbi:uncharacterized protein LOC100904158 [Galendromus occidentalis]|uniref:Uncharacterized protein LOC100904158 n=1 Tax=Galendromus occidentalis TaxID=34638 RepID=A0AAJ6QMP4_9ACAR|nr:uncharacterized protein LOC100904158 [Galendromus occidentalis]
MAPSILTAVHLITGLALCSYGFPVLDQPIYEAIGLPKVDIYYQGGVTSHFDKQLAPLPFVIGAKNNFKKSADDFRTMISNEIPTGSEDSRSAAKYGVSFVKSREGWTAPEMDSKADFRQTPRAFENWMFSDEDFQES